jgi:hypothetical protein
MRWRGPNGDIIFSMCHPNKDLIASLCQMPRYLIVFHASRARAVAPDVLVINMSEPSCSACMVVAIGVWELFLVVNHGVPSVMVAEQVVKHGVPSAMVVEL